MLASSGTGVDSLESRDCVDMDEEVSGRWKINTFELGTDEI